MHGGVILHTVTEWPFTSTQAPVLWYTAQTIAQAPPVLAETQISPFMSQSSLAETGAVARVSMVSASAVNSTGVFIAITRVETQFREMSLLDDCIGGGVATVSFLS